MFRVRSFHKFLIRITLTFLIFISLFFNWLEAFKKIKIEEINAAETAIDTVIQDATNEFGTSPSVVFTTDQIGYVFYIDSASLQDLAYRKTSDGGVVWDAAVIIDTAVTGWTSVAVWYDQWTPGDTTGTKIHIVASDDASDDIFYTYLDTATDTSKGSVITAVSGSTTLTESVDGPPSITKGVSGNLFISGNFTDTAGGKVSKCTDGTGDSWSDVTPVDWSSVAVDQIQLLPLSTGNDIIAIKAQTADDTIRYRIYDETTTDTWASSWSSISSLTENATYDQWFSASIKKSTGDVYLSLANNTNNSANDIEFWVFDESDRGSGFIQKANIFTNDATVMMPVPLIDEITGDIYVAYLRGILDDNMNTYFKKSTNSGTSWSDESSKLNAIGDDFKSLRGNLLGSNRLYVVWYNDDLNDILGSSVNTAIEVSIDDTIFDASDEFSASPSVVFTTNQIGYVFYIDATSQDLAYKKTIDGGKTWNNTATVIDTAVSGWISVSVWYDQWTPGDTTNTKIHIAAADDSAGDIYYTYLDTSNDELRGSVTVALNGTTFTECGNGPPSITKGAGNALFISANFTNYTGSAGGAVAKSTDGNGDTWSDITPTSWSSSGLDQIQILPLLTGSDIIAIKMETASNYMKYQIYDEATTDTWAGSWTDIAVLTENGTYDQWFSASIKKSTGDVYLSFANAITAVGNDIEFWVFDESNRTANFTKTSNNVISNDSTAISPVPLIDENTGDIYVAYLRGTLAATMSVYYKKSTDGGANWGSESSNLGPGVIDDHKSLRGNLLSTKRLYVVWYNDDLNDIMGNTVVSLISPFTVSGTVYLSDESITGTSGNGGPCDGIGAIVTLRVNGNSTRNTTCSSSNATFSFPTVSASAGDTLTLYLTSTSKANTVYVSDGSTDTGIDMYLDTVIVRDEQDGTVTIPDLWDYDSTGDDTNMLFDAVDDTVDTLTVETGNELHIWTGDTFAPGGNVSTPSLHVVGTYTGGSETLTISGNGTSTSRPLYLDGGTFTSTSNTVNYIGTSSTDIENGFTYYNLGVGINADSSTVSFNLMGSTTVSSVLTVGASSGSGTHTLVAGANTLTLTGTGNPFVVNYQGSFSAGSGTVSFENTTSATVSGNTYNNLQFNPDSGTPTYTLGVSQPENWYNTDWYYRKKITIDKDQVSGTNANFPVLISLTDTDLADINNGGHVAQSDGGDIVFIDSNGDKLNHEIETYTNTTGLLIAWVQIPSLSTAADTIVYVYYGNASVADQWSTEETWDNSFLAVHHMKDATSSTISDSTSLSNTGTKGSANNPDEITNGQIGNAQDFDADNEYVSFTDTSSWTWTPVTQDRTLSFWFYPTADPTNNGYPFQFLISSVASGNRFQLVWIQQGGAKVLMAVICDNAWNPIGYFYTLWSPTLNNWYHVTFVASSAGNNKIYVDGVSQSITEASWNDNTAINPTGTDIKSRYASSTGTGTLDEFRLSSSARSSDWLTTENNNQDSPGTFYEVDVEVVKPLNITVNSNLTLTGSGNEIVDVETNDPVLTVVGNLTIGASDTFQASSTADFNIGGSFSNSGTFTANSGTVVMDSQTSGNTLSGSMITTSAFNNLTFNDGGSSGEWTLSNALTTNGNLTITGGSLDSDSNTITVSGDWDNDDTFFADSGLVLFNASSETKTIDADGTGTDAFYDLTFDDGGGPTTFQLTTILDVDHNLTITGGTLDSNGNNITVVGNWTNDDIFIEGTAKVTLDGTISSNLDSGCATAGSCSSQNFYDLEINKSDSDETDDNVTLTSTHLTVSNTLTITDGELVQGVYDVYVSGSTSVSIGANGEWYNISTGDLTLGGTFSNSGTVTFDSNGLSCGDSDSIIITSTVQSGGNERNWIGSGTFNIEDITISYMSSTPAITALSSTEGSNVLANWTVITNCGNEAPTVTSVSLNGGSNIDLTENTTINISFTATVTDLDTFSDITSVQGRAYRSGVSGAEACTLNNNNCYEDSSCDLSGCSGNSCTATCTVAIYFHAESTATGGSYPSEYWRAWVEATDGSAETGEGFSAADNPQMNTLIALDITSSLAYGLLFAGDDTASDNESTTVTNTGNLAIDNEISGDHMCSDYPTCVGYLITVGYQEYYLTGFTYGNGTTLTTSPVPVDISLSKPTTSPSDSSGTIYWGMGIPDEQETGSYTGKNVVTAASDA